jgi:Fe2+ transport system protein FeoA
MFSSLITFWTQTRQSRRRDRSAFKQPDDSLTLSLNQVKPGQRVEVGQIVAGKGAVRQLAQLGIRAGAVLSVQRSAPLGGPIMVGAAGSAVAIGRGLASKVFVRVVK